MKVKQLNVIDYEDLENKFTFMNWSWLHKSQGTRVLLNKGEFLAEIDFNIYVIFRDNHLAKSQLKSLEDEILKLPDDIEIVVAGQKKGGCNGLGFGS